MCSYDFFTVYLQVQGSPANLDDQAIGVDLDSVTELNPARVGAGPGLPQAAPEDLARDLGHILHQVLDASNLMSRDPMIRSVLVMCHGHTKLISLLQINRFHC